jgi:hypothetical protein
MNCDTDVGCSAALRTSGNVSGPQPRSFLVDYRDQLDLLLVTSHPSYSRQTTTIKALHDVCNKWQGRSIGKCRQKPGRVYLGYDF